MKSPEPQESLFHLGVKIPTWMLNAIREVQQQMQRGTPEKAVTRTDAVLRILAKGLETLGFDIEKLKTQEESA